MHEMSIAEGILDIVLQHARNKVKTVRVRVGRLTEIMSEPLQFCFEAIRAGTLAESAQLEIEEVEVRCRCRQCECEFQMERFIMICPECKSRDLEFLSGNELQVTELEEEDVNP